MNNTAHIDKRQYVDPITGDCYNKPVWEKTPEFQREIVRYHDRVFHETKRTVHIETRRLTIDLQGSLCKVSLSGGVPRPKPAKRGLVMGFSPQSRNRLLEKFTRLKKPAHTSMITLTYGAMFPSPERAKENLRAFLERLRRMPACEKSSGFWRLEPQKRGAPHFHFIAFNLPFIPKRKIQRMWSQIVKGTGRRKVTAVRTYRKFPTKTARMRHPFTRIEAVRAWNGIMSYASKYIAKKQEDFRGGSNGFIYLSYLHGLGRVWGVWQKKQLPLADRRLIVQPFFYYAFTKFRRIACLIYPPLLEQESPGFKLFIRNAIGLESVWRSCADLTF